MQKSLNGIKIYHIIHLDRFESIASDGFLYCDADIAKKQGTGSTIGMSHIKKRRLTKTLSSFPDLTVGKCVPFYFCPRSVMLYVIKCQDHPDLSYLGGQRDILHLVFDLQKVLIWAQANNLRACYTTSNAGSLYFDDHSDFSKIKITIDWDSVNAKIWSGENIAKHIKERKQSEFLIENKLSISLLELVGVYNLQNYNRVNTILNRYKLTSKVSQEPDWYY